MSALRNLGLSKKLFLSLMLIAVVGMLIGLVGISATASLSDGAHNMYKYNTLPMRDLAAMYDNLASQRIGAANMIVYRDLSPEFAQDERDSIVEKGILFDEAFASYGKVLSNDEEQQLYDNIKRMYYNDFKLLKENVLAAVDSGDIQAMSDAMYELDSKGSDISDYMDQAFVLNEKLSNESVLANQKLQTSRTMTLIFSMIAGAILAIVFAAYLSNVIGKPIKTMSGFFQRFGSMGDLTLSEADQGVIAAGNGRKDEIGMCIGGASMMVGRIMEINEKLSKIANGDLNIDIDVLSSHDTLGMAINKVIESLNRMFAEIHTSTAQITAGTKQVADGAQSLAQGSTQQASAIQQLSASISEIANQTTSNAGVARDAADLSANIRDSAEEGSTQMERMMQAVKEINEASGRIGMIIKVIDDIAFQTNLLALNAAVEAARAGQHGKGFAVVAEEVRNLAAKSAEAAKDTGGLIENSMEKANLGLSIATETSASLKRIVEGINHSAEIVLQIARSSDEQAGAITQINTGIDQVAHVVQQNSATAQQSAAASQQMSSQADMLEQLLSQFILKDEGEKALPFPEVSTFSLPESTGGYGKY